jgi:hypothetical protein
VEPGFLIFEGDWVGWIEEQALPQTGKKAVIERHYSTTPTTIRCSKFQVVNHRTEAKSFVSRTTTTRADQQSQEIPVTRQQANVQRIGTASHFTCPKQNLKEAPKSKGKQPS